ncbi:MAG: DUF4038 domain-containing protein [Acholeplasmatales bacterium]|nr:DUF4038 domain-containing protein [Acholeplasmatales bacterium]
MNKLTVKDNYLYENNKPFFWLGDTAWLLFDKLNKNEAKIYLRNRKSLGYNVIQAVLVYAIPEFETQDRMPHSDNNVHKLEYWNYVKEIVEYAKSLEIYMALLPTWGSFAKLGYLNNDNVIKYVKFLTSFFNSDNIIWVLGGDVRGDACYDVFNTFGNELKKLDPNRLVTFHPFGRTGSYLWFNEQNWLDFNMFQSGHRRYDQLVTKRWDDNDPNEDTFGESSYKYVIKNFSYNIKKPCLDAEPSYEGVVQGLHDPHEPYWEACHVRRYAYFSVFEGACGFTYGNNAIIQFYIPGDKGSYGVRETWQEGLHSPGGSQMQYLKELMESIDFVNGSAHTEYILNQKERCHRISCFAGENYILCYTFYGDLIELDLSKYKNKKMAAYWINPENNSRSYIDTFEGYDSYKFRPTRKRELSNDWVLMLIEE